MYHTAGGAECQIDIPAEKQGEGGSSAPALALSEDSTPKKKAKTYEDMSVCLQPHRKKKGGWGEAFRLRNICIVTGICEKIVCFFAGICKKIGKDAPLFTVESDFPHSFYITCRYNKENPPICYAGLSGAIL